jgi:hypothetical protein
MLRRPPRIVRALLVLTVLAVAVFGASGGFASSHKPGSSAPPTSSSQPNAPAETIQKCLKTLAGLQAQLNHFKKLRKDALEKRIYLYTIARVSGNPIFVAVSVAEFKSLVTAELLAGDLSPKQLLQLIREMREMTVDNLQALGEYIASFNADAAKQKKHCDALRQGGTTTTPKPPPPPAAGTFTLRPALTEVKNPNANELHIDTAGTAVDDHTGPNGGAGKGGEWKVKYSWEVPQTLTPGKTSKLTIGLEFESVNPSQPLGMQIGALAPDFVGAVQAHWPDTPSSSKTYDVLIHESQKDSPDIAVTIGMLSANVIYHYRK